MDVRARLSLSCCSSTMRTSPDGRRAFVFRLAPSRVAPFESRSGPTSLSMDLSSVLSRRPSQEAVPMAGGTVPPSQPSSPPTKGAPSE